VARELRKLHNEELHSLYTLPSNLVKDKMGGSCSSHGTDEKCTRNFGRKTLKTRRRWKDNIRIDISEIVWKRFELIHLAQVREIGGEFLDWLSDY
jgi:hypothetical protein